MNGGGWTQAVVLGTIEVCWSCAGMGQPLEPALYVWETPAGHEVSLCEACCAAWRMNGAREPDLAPVRVYDAPWVRR